MATISRLSVSLSANTRRFKKGMRSAKKMLGSFVSSVFSAKTAIVGLIGAAGLGLMAKNVIDVNSRIQTLKASLRTMMGSARGAADGFKDTGARMRQTSKSASELARQAENADKAFANIREFAQKTPFDLEQVVSAFVKLKSLGLEPNERSLTSFGNIASAMGVELNQVIEAVADAVTGEFERLKELGITTKSEGDKVKVTFQGLTKTIGKNATEIQEFLRGIGENQFGGAMKEQVKDLKPAFSNLGDAFDAIKIKIGESGINRLVTAIAVTISEFLNGLSTESIANFTKSVVGMAFSFARSIVSMIVWIGELFTNMTSFNTMWLTLQLGMSKFADHSLAAFAAINDGFLAMVRSMLNAAMELPSWLWGDEVREGLHHTIEGAKSLDSIINNIRAGQASTTAGIRGELAQSRRADRSLGFDETIKGKLANFASGAEELFKKLEASFAGEDTKKKVGGTRSDPRLVNIDKGIQQLVDLQRTYRPGGAVAQ